MRNSIRVFDVKHLVKNISYVFLFIALFPFQAWSITGNELKTFCNDEGLYVSGFCMGFISGVSEVLNSTGVTCLPTTVTFEQMRDIALDYIDENPHKRHQNAIVLILEASGQVRQCD